MIAVFKTSVKTKGQVRQLKPHFDRSLPGAKWNFDLRDRDKILRIDDEENVTMTVIDLLHSQNFYCEELE